MKLYPPRDYQHDQLNFLNKYDGQNICTQSPTGSGKSNLIAHRVSQHLDNRERILILAPKQELCDNILQNMSDVATVAYSGVMPLLSKKVLITTPQSAAKHVKRFRPTRVIADECFVKDTLIDGLPIQLLKVGDYVTAFNENIKQLESCKVLNVFKSKPTTLLTLNFNNGKKITCTYGHPFYTINGWIEAFNLTSENLIYEACSRQEKRSNFKLVRLESLTIHQQTSDGTFNGMCQDGYVYNIEVENLHTYTADNFIVHNCHHVIANNQSALIKSLNLPLEGFTATPTRLDGKGLYTHFKRLSVAPSIKWFIDQQYLSPFELIASKAPLFETSKGDALDEQQNIFIPHIKDSVTQWLDVARGLKTLIFCASILHADMMLQEFLNSGINAAVIHSGNSKLREPILRAFELGKIQVLINVEFATEGVNIPDIQCVMLCRFTYSTALYLQMVGRVLRYIEGKIALILDLANNSYYHGAVDTPFIWSLEGQPFKAKSNQESIHNRCFKCDSVLCHKKSVIEDALVSCLQCQTINQVVVIVTAQRNVKASAIHQVFSVDDLHRITDTSVTQLTRILLGSDKKRFSKENKIAAICDLDIEFDLKKKALKYIGLNDKEFDLYFGD